MASLIGSRWDLKPAAAPAYQVTPPAPARTGSPLLPDLTPTRGCPWGPLELTWKGTGCWGGGRRDGHPPESLNGGPTGHRDQYPCGGDVPTRVSLGTRLLPASPYGGPVGVAPHNWGSHMHNIPQIPTNGVPEDTAPPAPRSRDPWQWGAPTHAKMGCRARGGEGRAAARGGGARRGRCFLLSLSRRAVSAEKRSHKTCLTRPAPLRQRPQRLPGRGLRGARRCRGPPRGALEGVTPTGPAPSRDRGPAVTSAAAVTRVTKGDAATAATVPTGCGQTDGGAAPQGRRVGPGCPGGG